MQTLTPTICLENLGCKTEVQPEGVISMANENKSINRLKGADNFKFLTWFSNQTFEYGLTDSQIAVRATDALGMVITVGNVYGAWEATGKVRPKHPVDGEAKIQILKRALETLYSGMGMQLPPEWSDL